MKGSSLFLYRVLLLEERKKKESVKKGKKKSCIVKMSYLFVYKARYIVKKLDVLYNKPDKSKKFAQQEEHYERE